MGWGSFQKKMEGSSIAVSCGVDCRHGSDLALLWLWCRPAAVALIQPLAWEPLYAAGVALKRQKTKKRKEKKERKGMYICLTGSLCWGQKTDIQPNSQAKGILPASTFALFKPSTDCLLLTHAGEGHLLYSVYQCKCWSHPETPSETHPEIMFHQLSGYPRAQEHEINYPSKLDTSWVTIHSHLPCPCVCLDLLWPMGC